MRFRKLSTPALALLLIVSLAACAAPSSVSKSIFMRVAIYTINTSLPSTYVCMHLVGSTAIIPEVSGLGMTHLTYTIKSRVAIGKGIVTGGVK